MTNNLIIEQDTSLFNNKTKDNHFTPEDDKKSVNDDVMTEEDTDTEVEEDAVHKPFLNLPDTKYENKPEFHPYQNDDEITYHPTFFDDQASSNSQLQQEISSPNALCPPSHVLKARRLSKNAIQSSTSTPIGSTTKPSKITRKHSFVDSMNSNSAVSPRFMALRKLSEVTTLPSHSISYSSVPPVPQIPSIYQQLSDDHAKSHPPDQEFENRIINRIDDVLETQLQFHLGQVVWKSSEGYLDARQFWEDQKKEMFGFAASLIERLESHAQTHTVEDSIKQELNEYKMRCKLQSETLEKYKNKYQQHKTRYEETVNSLNDYKRKYEDMQRQVEELKAKQEEHKTNMKQANEKIHSHLETIAQLKESNNKLLNDSKFIKPSRSASIVSELLRKKSLSAGTDWADIMESEDEAKKSAEEWALKYRELQASYFDVCLKLEKNKSVSDDELNQSMSKKDQEIRHLKQAENVSRVQIEYLQSELLKYQQQQVRPNRQQHNRKQKKTVAENNSREPGYVTEDGYLIFTTEINGKPSKYSIKIPNSCR